MLSGYEKYQFYEIENYKIEFYRYKNDFSYSQFSQYKFFIIVTDKSTGVQILKITANEKRMYDLVIDLYQYNMYSSYMIASERVWFSPDENGIEFIIEISAIPVDYPTELEYSKLIFYQYDRINNSVIPRISINLDEFQIEDFVYQAWLTLEGLTHLKDIGRSEIDDYLDFLGANQDAINLE